MESDCRVVVFARVVAMDPHAGAVILCTFFTLTTKK
jgi:hypothetical protein